MSDRHADVMNRGEFWAALTASTPFLIGIWVGLVPALIRPKFGLEIAAYSSVIGITLLFGLLIIGSWRCCELEVAG